MLHQTGQGCRTSRRFAAYVIGRADGPYREVARGFDNDTLVFELLIVVYLSRTLR
jgi:hypothetical protein